MVDCKRSWQQHLLSQEDRFAKTVVKKSIAGLRNKQETQQTKYCASIVFLQ